MRRTEDSFTGVEDLSLEEEQKSISRISAKLPQGKAEHKVSPEKWRGLEELVDAINSSSSSSSLPFLLKTTKDKIGHAVPSSPADRPMIEGLDKDVEWPDLEIELTEEKPRCAYVSFLEGDSDYLMGVIALARSLRLHGCRYPLIVATTPTVPETALRRLRLEPNVEVRPVEWLSIPEEHLEHCSSVLANPQFIRNYTKLRLWEWTDIKKAVYLDADTLVFQNIDDVFLAPAFSAVLDNMEADEYFDEAAFQVPSPTNKAPFDCPARSYFNAGVFVFEPSLEQLGEMMKSLSQRKMTRFAEQDFLNEFFRGRWNALPLSYNFGKPNFWLKPSIIPFDALKVVHFSGAIKPWMRKLDGSFPDKTVSKAPLLERNTALGLNGMASANLSMAIDEWWRAYCFLPHLPRPSMTPSIEEDEEELKEAGGAPRVLFVVHRYYPFKGGSEYYVHWLASEAVARGWDVSVLADVHAGDQGDIKLTSDVSILTAQKFDAIVVHGADCCTQDSCLKELDAGRVASPLVYLIILPSKSQTAMAGLKHADIIGCSTTADWDHVKAFNVRDRAVQVTHGIEASTVIGRPGFRERWQLPSTSRLFVSAGGFGPHKRMLELAQAFGKARRTSDHLFLFGYQEHPEGEAYLDRCREVEGVTVVLGAERQEVLDCLAEADLYIMNSEWEGFGLVLLEAMLNGCEWIADAGAGAASDLAGAFGKVYSDQEGLVELLRDFERGDEKRRNAIKAAANARYTVKQSIDDLHRGLCRLLGDEGVKRFGEPPAPLTPRSIPLLQPSFKPNVSGSPTPSEGEESDDDASTTTSSLTSSSSTTRDVSDKEVDDRPGCLATLLMGSGDYIKGVLALKASLDQVKTTLPFVVAVTEDVPAIHRAQLQAAGCVLRPVEPITPPSGGNEELRPHFALCYTKLQLWAWSEYARVIYIDADMVVSRNIDCLAQVDLNSLNAGHGKRAVKLDDVTGVSYPRIPIAAARDFGLAADENGLCKGKNRPYFNAGLMVLEPSVSIYEHLVQRLNEVILSGVSLPYGEQSFLNEHVGVALVELPQDFNCQCEQVGTLRYDSELLACLPTTATTTSRRMNLPAVIHFCGPKPWRGSRPRSGGGDELASLCTVEVMEKYWWDMFEQSTSDESPNESAVAV